jgi:hypothetical protein
MLRQCHAALGLTISCVKGNKRGSSDRYDTELDFSINTLRKNSLCAPEFHWSPRPGKQEYHTQGAQIGQTSHPPTPARRDAPFHEQGRSGQRSTEVQTALRVGRSPQEWILANGKVPPALPTSENLIRHVEPNERGENAVWEMTRLGAPGRGGRATFAASF